MLSFTRSLTQALETVDMWRLHSDAVVCHGLTDMCIDSQSCVVFVENRFTFACFIGESKHSVCRLPSAVSCRKS